MLRRAAGGQTADRASRCVARFEVRHSQFLSEDGEPLAPLPPFARDAEHLVPLYEAMVLTRVFDAKAVALQRTGQLGTYAASLGQEATTVGLGSAMRPEDVLLPSYRETGAMLLRGVRMLDLLLYWGGDERGMAFPEAPPHDFPICVPIASHAPHAVGVAYAFKLRREPRVAVCVLGDGATSKGDFYEALNAAGVWQLPVVFVINNNQWAISVPRRVQSRAETLAQKAISAGIEGEQVDGNDVIAVRHVVGEAIAKARAGRGPHVIEALTYRLSDHTTADDARRYRSEAEVATQRALDPIRRLRKHLERLNAWSDEQEEQLQARCSERVEQAVREYAQTTPPPPEHMFEHLFEKLPEPIERQRNEVSADSRG